MASIQSIAITRDEAYESLERTTRILSARLGIDAPQLNIHKRHPIEYRQAQELKRMAAFLEAVANSEISDTKLDSVIELVSKGDKNWTKAQLRELVGVEDDS